MKDLKGKLKGIKIGLVPKLIISIALGILVGMYFPLWVCRTAVTLSGLFSSFLRFVIPLMIVAYITTGIADLARGAGQILLLTVLLSYISTLIAGTGAFMVGYSLFFQYMDPQSISIISATAETALKPFIALEIVPVLDTLSAVALAFILGLSLSAMRGKEIGNSLYNGTKDFSVIVDKTLGKVVIPLLPVYILGTFVEMTRTGKTFAVLNILWKVFIIVILMHLVCIVVQFFIAGAVSRKNPFWLMKNQIPAYTTALGTQSSAATIPVNLKCAEADGISETIRNFTVPLCANIHMAGSMISIISCATAVCLMYQLPISLEMVVPFILTLGIAMVASPGVPGGAVMTALPFLHILFGPEAGDPNGPVCAILLALHITQDSFGTACNVSGDNAIGVIVDTVYRKISKNSSL